MEEIRLRPHHLLCIQKFVGKGYDGVFTSSLAKLVEYLRTHPETKVTLTEGCDEVCTACPNKAGEACEDGEKIIEIDNGVLDACKLIYGLSDTWLNLSRAARERIFGTDKFEEICGSCQWFYICKNKAE